MQTNFHLKKQYKVRSRRLDLLPITYTLHIESGESEVIIFNDKELTLNTVDHLVDVFYRFAEDVLNTKNPDELEQLINEYMEEV